MNTLNMNQITTIMKRFPSFELSYETISHKKVSNEYQATLAIPYGKKAFLWFSFYRDKNVCFCMELNREKKVTIMKVINMSHIPNNIAYGTILYGSICEIEEKGDFFVIEDVIYSEGVFLAKQQFSEKLGFLTNLMNNYPELFVENQELPIVCPVMWSITEENPDRVPHSWLERIPYQIHHLQHRSLTSIVPYINIPMARSVLPPLSKSGLPSGSEEFLFIPPQLPHFHFGKPQYNMATVFVVKADLQNDIYHLYAFGKGAERVYCGIAYIPSVKTSFFMNHLFRDIKENRNLDALEESDDEDDFQDMRIDKYVDLKKEIPIECLFHSKFKRWVPLKVAEGARGKIVHIRQLC
jgi:hypothetical protein